MKALVKIFTVCLLLGTALPSEGQAPRSWACTLMLQGEQVHFTLEEKLTRTFPPQFIIWNGKERIDLNFNQKKGDSLICPISIFENQLVLPNLRGDTFTGQYVKPGLVSLPFRAKANPSKPKRQVPIYNPVPIGSYFTYFYKNELPIDSGIFNLQQIGDSIYGTMLNETGDYRFLNGRIAGQEAYLQTFDGSHSFHFKFQLSPDSIRGQFISGPKGKTFFKGSSKSAKKLKAGFDIISTIPYNISFSAFDEKGKPVSQADYKGQALVIQLLGSWCPNCLDETRFLKEFYAKKPSHVQFIGIAFERKDNLIEAFERINTMKARLGIPYPIYWGGQANKDSASKVLGNKFKVQAFPTTLFVDRTGRVRKIHSGFSGPATGEAYNAWKKEFEELLKEL